VGLLHVIPGGRVFPGVGVGVGWAVGVGVLGVEGDDPPPQAASAATIAAQRTNETDVLVFNGAPRKRGRRRPRLTNLAGRRPDRKRDCRASPDPADTARALDAIRPRG
jgi:hypothetical protein